MRVRFQYADWTEWEGSPERAGDSPDKGVIRMHGITDTGRVVEFVYDDFYFIYRDADGAWVLGSGTPKREFRFVSDTAEAIERPVLLPEGAVVRKGQTVSQEEAVLFGLIESIDEKRLHDKRDIPVTRGGCC